MASPALVLNVRFKSRLSLDEAKVIMEERLPDFQALSALKQKYYVHNPETGEIGGIYVWQSREGFLEYRESELRASIAAAYQTEGEPRIEVLEVLRELRD